MVGVTEPADGGGVATDAEATRGRVLFTNSCDETGSDRGYRPMCARWRSTAAIATAVIASTICCIEGGKSAPGAYSALVSATREGRRCACSRRLDIRGGNGGASLSLCPQREICAGVLAICRVDLVLRVRRADGSRYPKSRKGLPV